MTAAATLREVEEYFHGQIPITHHMGVRVVACDESRFIVEAPVALNSNHLGTAFGGSINAVATLAGYGLLWFALREHGAHLVIAESSIRFFRTVNQTIRATCLHPGAEEWEAFRTRFDRKGKARITLRVSVAEKDEPTAAFEGIFVARSSQHP